MIVLLVLAVGRGRARRLAARARAHGRDDRAGCPAPRAARTPRRGACRRCRSSSSTTRRASSPTRTPSASAGRCATRPWRRWPSSRASRRPGRLLGGPRDRADLAQALVSRSRSRRVERDAAHSGCTSCKPAQLAVLACDVALPHRGDLEVEPAARADGSRA